MKLERKLQFNWKPFFDIDNGASSIFTHVTHDHYNPNAIFPGYVNDIDLNMTDANILSQIDNILNWAKKERSAYLTNNILMLYGDDFTHKKPDINFMNIERIMNYFEKDPNLSNQLKFIYSTPSKYFKSVKNYNSSFPEIKNYDFFPYADSPYAYWTGYFTSRPYLKGLVRDAGKLLFTASRLLFEQNLKESQMNNSHLL